MSVGKRKLQYRLAASTISKESDRRFLLYLRNVAFRLATLSEVQPLIGGSLPKDLALYDAVARDRYFSSTRIRLRGSYCRPERYYPKPIEGKQESSPTTDPVLIFNRNPP